jgi:GNAT superfamily N-acetyltransferase
VETRTLEQVVAYYESIGADAVLLAIPPTARPSSLPRTLETLGFKAGFREAKLYRQTEHQPPADTFALIRLATRDDVPELTALLVASGIAPDLSRFIMSAVGRDGWRHYIAHENGAAVAVAAMFIHLRTAWFIPGLTDRDHRRRGYQRALTSHRIAEARRQGCTRVTTNIAINESEPPGLSFGSHTRLGFQLLYLRTTYFWQRPGTPPPDMRGR